MHIFYNLGALHHTGTNLVHFYLLRYIKFYCQIWKESDHDVLSYRQNNEVFADGV